MQKSPTTSKRKRAHFSDDPQVIEYSFRKSDSLKDNDSLLLDDNENYHFSPISNPTLAEKI